MFLTEIIRFKLIKKKNNHTSQKQNLLINTYKFLVNF